MGLRRRPRPYSSQRRRRVSPRRTRVLASTVMIPISPIAGKRGRSSSRTHPSSPAASRDPILGARRSCLRHRRDGASSLCAGRERQLPHPGGGANVGGKRRRRVSRLKQQCRTNIADAEEPRAGTPGENAQVVARREKNYDTLFDRDRRIRPRRGAGAGAGAEEDEDRDRAGGSETRARSRRRAGAAFGPCRAAPPGRSGSSCSRE